MKAVISTFDSVCYYLLEDDQSAVIKDGFLVIDKLSGGKLYVQSENFLFIENMDNPLNWESGKYKIIENQWIINPLYFPFVAQ